MDFNQKAVSADRGCAAAKHFYQVGPSTALTRVHNDGEMRLLFGNGDGRQIKRIASIGLKCPDTAFTKQDAGVAVCQEVFSGKHPFFNSLVHAAFQEDWFARFSALDQELEILSVARPNLQDISGFCHVFYVPFAQDFSNDLKSGFPASEVQNAQTFFA